jgi:hypothetical protein
MVAYLPTFSVVPLPSSYTLEGYVALSIVRGRTSISRSRPYR